MPADRIVLVVYIIVIITSLSRVFCRARDHLSAPFDPTFETLNLCTISAIQKGKNLYGPANYSNP